MVIVETSNRIPLGIVDGEVLPFQALVFEAGAVIGVQLVRDIPVVRGIKRQFVFMPLIIFLVTVM